LVLNWAKVCQVVPRARYRIVTVEFGRSAQRPFRMELVSPLKVTWPPALLAFGVAESDVLVRAGAVVVVAELAVAATLAGCWTTGNQQRMVRLHRAEGGVQVIGFEREARVADRALRDVERAAVAVTERSAPQPSAGKRRSPRQ
jgi:hypothetical protein